MVAAALLSAYLKGEEQLTLQIQGESPRVAIYVDQTADGHLRARTTPPALAAPDGVHGVMLAIKSVGTKEVYRGASRIDGTIESALAQHLGDSAQVDAVLRLHSRVDADGKVTAASGLLLERLPDEPGQPTLSREAFDARYRDLRDADVGQLMTQLAFGNLQGEAIQVLDKVPLTWRCRCSRERVAATLMSLGATELQAMIDEDHGAEVTCHFCNEAYRFDEAQLQALLDA
jgi:molecular chaperone Hsp33